ncbi:hypothetical protein [Methylobacter sp. YRD-M1]|uniref:hypothetical protein n=1 Tax=Methylobacter sp. YRD-M1 TaxID=2911520 RepID=UPI00227B0843|nr:hypothetical protein [Methylobacter sp. YRD-M1]WAK00663.1 hypothetical protein LZ558_12475 [Methylobacter sp. YRD-M1]
MLSITPEQIAVFDSIQRDNFIIRLDQFLRDNALLEPPLDPNDVYEQVDRLVARAEQLGIHSELGIAYYAILASQFGESMQAIADRSWFSVLQKYEGELVDPDWIERVFLTITDCLQLDKLDTV